MARSNPQLNPVSVDTSVPLANVYQPEDQTDKVAANLNTSAGYAVTLPRIRQATWNTVNGYLYAPDGIYMPLFIVEYSTSFTMEGITGQSQMVRTFFPHNFAQPGFRVAGQSPNQYYYNRLGEFIRYFQRKSISMAQPGKLLVPDGNRTSASDPGDNAANSLPTRVSNRGLNRGFLAEGYVKNVNRGGERFQFAPDFDFEFTVSNMLDGLYHEDPVTIHKLRSWAEIFKDERHVWELDPDTADKTAAIVGSLADQVGRLGGHSWSPDLFGG